MSEQERVRRALLIIAMTVLIVYVIIDCFCDRRDEYYMLDLQRRVGQLEQQVNQ